MGDKFHLEILPKRQRILFDVFSRSDWISQFYLAGGTSLALQIAHRRSIDFDFFSEQEFDTRLVKEKLAKIGDYQILSESEQILDGRLNDVRASFFNLPFRLIRPVKNFWKLRIISKEDAAAMKLSAISMRGSRKDFIDIYFLLKEFSLEQMFDYFRQKYGENKENIFCALKGLVYFNDAEEMPMPSMIRHVVWGNIKKTILSAHKKYIDTLRNE